LIAYTLNNRAPTNREKIFNQIFLIIAGIKMNSTQVTDEHFAARLRGFGLTGIIAILLILFTGNIVLPNMVSIPVGAVLVLLWARLSHTPWREIGYAKPANWIITILGGIVAGIAFKLLMKIIVMPLLGADPINQTYHFLAGNAALLPAAIWAMLVAGFAEETVFRGWMFERLYKILGTRRAAGIIVVLFTTILFSLSHYNQGVAGMEQAIFTGLVFGTIFAVTRNIWFVMVAHAFFDLAALTIIYLNIETQVARLLFK
jgi:membrane protease YdiL (CAAX protease family)